MNCKRHSHFILFGRSPSEYCSKGLWMFLTVYVMAFIIGGIFGPLLYTLVLELNASYPRYDLWSYLAEKEFPRYIDRVRLLAVVVSLVWLVGYCKLWGRFGFGLGKVDRLALSKGYVVGVASLVPVICLQALVLDVHLKESVDLESVISILFSALVGGLILSFLEEAVFRGMVFRMFYSAMRPLFAVVLSAVFFAISHFKSVNLADVNTNLWYAGLEVAWRSFSSIYYTFEAFSFLTYLFVGLILNLLFLRTHSLMACVGLHAGWIFVLNSWSDLVHISDSPLKVFFGSIGVVDGILPISILILMSFVLYFYPVSGSSPKDSSSDP